MFDMIIIGAGPAGLSASVYAKRAGLNALLIEESPINGGQVNSTYEVDNYLGLPGVSGIELSEKFSEHATKAGIERREATVEKIEPDGDAFIVHTDNGNFDGKRIIVATGAKHALLGVPGEEELQGCGVSYCATCDGAFFKGRDVCVVGGSDVAVEDAIYLARTCRNVYLIHRRDALRAANSLVESLKAQPNVTILWDTVVEKINGEDQVEGVSLLNKRSGEKTELTLQGVFVAVGINPSSSLLDGLVDMDEKGYVLAGEDCRTSRSGIYVAGDVRKKPLRQIITAVADGANAVSSVTEDL